MTGAVALAIVLVVAVMGMSLALQSQRAAEGGQMRQPRIPRQPRPRPPGPPVAEPRPRRTGRGVVPRMGRRAPPPSPPPEPAASAPEAAEQKLPELLTTGVVAQAKVLSVVDERTIGPVTRSRLTLRIEPGQASPSSEPERTQTADAAGPADPSKASEPSKPSEPPQPFEVSTRVSFPTPEARASVKVGGTVQVRYDPDDHSRVVVDIPLG